MWQSFLQPVQLLWLHMHGLSFMIKLWAESLVFMSAVYAWPLYEVPQPLCIINVKCKIHGMWLQANWQTHVSLQCSPASVWLAHGCSNNSCWGSATTSTSWNTNIQLWENTCLHRTVLQAAGQHSRISTNSITGRYHLLTGIYPISYDSIH